MDKFTVDLDKVLNDFEYNELTDSSSNVPSKTENIPNSHSEQSTNYRPGYHLTVKHSINNVFQSLNDYISTEISDKPKPYIPHSSFSNSSGNSYDNNNYEVSSNSDALRNSVVTDSEPSTSTVDTTAECGSRMCPQESLPINHDTEEEIYHEAREESDSNSDRVLSEEACNDPVISSDVLVTNGEEDTRNTVEIVTISADHQQVPEKLEKPNCKENLIVDTIEVNLELNENPTTISSGDEAEFNSGKFNETCDNKIVSSSIECDKNLVVSDIEKAELEEVINDLPDNDNIKATDTEANNVQIETDGVTAVLTNTHNDIVQDKANILSSDVWNKEIEYVEFSDQAVDTSLNVERKSATEENRIIAEITSNEKESVVEQDKPILETALDKKESTIEKKKPVPEISFDSSLVSLNDSELNEYLNQIEKEYESQYKTFEEEENNSATKKITSEEFVIDESKINENVANLQRDIPVEYVDSVNDNKTVIKNEVKGMVINTENENTYVNNENINSESEVECNDVNKEDESVNDKNKELESVSDEVIIAAEEQEQIRNEENENNRMLSRPSSLDLKSVQNEDKKEISLIGEPGSTPYNNVYVSKVLNNESIEKPVADIDSENSSCTSPTFSNASTETLSSSDSSDGYEEPKENPTSANEPPKETSEVPSNMENEISEVNPAEKLCSQIGSSESASALEGDNRRESEDNQNNCERIGRDGSADQRELNVETEEGSGGDFEVSKNVEVPTRTFTGNWIGKQAPVWIPDSDAMNCMHCDMKFTVIKRRHHCRACGLVLCSKCCNLRHRLEYLECEARVCTKCHEILAQEETAGSMEPPVGSSRPNPNNPGEYCSTVPPLQQVQGASGTTNPPAVLVPVLKRQGSHKTRTNKSVMFCDGIRPGSELTSLDDTGSPQTGDGQPSQRKKGQRRETASPGNAHVRHGRNGPLVDPETRSFVPSAEIGLPPTVTMQKTETNYVDRTNGLAMVDILKKGPLTFAIQKNLLVHVKIINMDCCINKTTWCFSTEGLINVGQDEVVILLEMIQDEALVPKDIFLHINQIYFDAIKGSSVKEMGISVHAKPNFLESKNHAGFIYIKPTFQCLQKVIKPKEPYLIGLLIHRWETPWAKLFPLRLVLRLGAEYRYYPSPIISTRHRDSVFVEIRHTIINLLADFRNFSYTLPQIRGLTIHMEDKNTTITIPSNRYDQVMKSITNSSDHILAFAGNFSPQADSHLVCIQDTQSNDNAYSTHAINIHNRPRKVTGASFVVFNGALKSSSGLTAKSSIVEDGLMVQILPEHMVQFRENLRNMRDHIIKCGCVNATTDEIVNVVWGEPDTNFNIGILSPIDGQSMTGVPSIRVHNGKDYTSSSGSRLIRWTEVFILQNSESEPSRNQDPADISKLSEAIARATCQALVRYLDLLVSNGLSKLALRATLHADNVSYLAGGNGHRLPPIYMRSLDDELVPVLHRLTCSTLGEGNLAVVELVFRILNV